MSLMVYAVSAKKEENEFNLFEAIVKALNKNNIQLVEGDVILISSKYVSNSQGRIIAMDKVKISSEAKKLAKKFKLGSELAEIIVRESDQIFGGIPGFVITYSNNIMAPNAGIDKSNVGKGKVILYPTSPYHIAEQLRRKIFVEFSIHVGVLIIDSRLMPARVGTTGIAIACAGIEPVNDMRTEEDLHGNPLKVTFQGVVDNLASIANHKMGEASESVPIVIIRNSGSRLTNRMIDPNEISISSDQCVYVRGLREAKKEKFVNNAFLK